jgi:ubiquitin-conjugating enzyme E2 M
MILTITPDVGFWEGGVYKFSIKIPDMYPHDPPKVKCETSIYHPNIDLEGHVCLNILRADWKPILDVNVVIYGIIFLFYEPNPNDPLNQEAAAMLRDNPEKFKSQVNLSLRGGKLEGSAKNIKFPKFL